MAISPPPGQERMSASASASARQRTCRPKKRCAKSRTGGAFAVRVRACAAVLVLTDARLQELPGRVGQLTPACSALASAARSPSPSSTAASAPHTRAAAVQLRATAFAPPRTAASSANCPPQAFSRSPSPSPSRSPARLSFDAARLSFDAARRLRRHRHCSDLRSVATPPAPRRCALVPPRRRLRRSRCMDTMDADISGDDNRSAPSGLHQPGYEPGRRHNLRPPQFPGEPCSSSLLPSRDGGARAALAAPIAVAGPSPGVDVDAERYYRSFRSISGLNSFNSLDTNALASMPAVTDASRLPSSLRSNSNGTTPRHPPIAPSRNLKSPYRSVSAPVDEGMAAGSTRAVSSGSGTQKPNVRDLARRFDSSNTQASASTHNKPSARVLKDVGGHGAGSTKTRAASEMSASSSLAKPSTNVQDTELSRTKSNTKSQRTRFAAEDQRSNNALSSVPRPNRSGAKDITANTHAAQSSTSLNRRPPPLKLPTKIPERKPLFGELPPNASGSSNLGYGIPNRRLSDPSSPLTQHRGEVAPKSSTSPPATAGELRRDMEGSRVPRVKKHGRSHSDLGEDKAGSGTGANSNSIKSPTQSRLPISAKRLSSPSESSSPSSTRSASPLASKARSPASRRPAKGDMGPRSPMTRSPTETHKSPGRHARGLTNISTASLSAIISVSPPKSSPPLRGSRQRLPVSTASAPRLKTKAAEQTIDYEAHRRRIERSYSRSIRRNEENLRREPERNDQTTVKTCDLGEELAIKSSENGSPASATIEINHEELPVAIHGALLPPSLDIADMDSPTLGMPGIFPTAFHDEDNSPQSSTPATAGAVESDREERANSPRHSEGPHPPRPPMILTSAADIQPQYNDSPLEIYSGTGSIKIILDANSISEPLEALSADSGDGQLPYVLPAIPLLGGEETPTIEAVRPASRESNKLGERVDDLCTLAANTTGGDIYFEEPQPLTDVETCVDLTSSGLEQPQGREPQALSPMPDMDLGFSASGNARGQNNASPVTEMDYGEEEGGAEGLHGLPGHYDIPHSARLSIHYPHRLPTQNSVSEWTDDIAVTTIDPGLASSDRLLFVDKPAPPPPKEDFEPLRPEVPPKPPHYSPLPSPGLTSATPRKGSPSRSLHNDYSPSVENFGTGSSLKSPSRAHSVPQISPPLTSPSHLAQARGETTYLQPSQPLPSPRCSPARMETGESPARSDVREEPLKPVVLTEEELAKLTKRGHIIKEMIDTEAIYLKDMNVVEEIYRGTAEACPNLEPADIKIIFRNSSQIVGFSTMFLDELKAAAACVYTPRAPRSRSSAISPGAGDATAPFNSPHPGTRYERDQKTYIGALFLRHLKEMKEVYTEFLRRHEQAMTRLSALQPTPTVKVWLDECNLVAKDLTSAWDLDALLIKPVQRITRYQLFFLELKGKTPENHPDYLSILAGRKGLVDLLHSIDTLKERLDTVTKIVNGNPKVNVRSGLVSAFVRRRDRSLAISANRHNDDPEFVKAHDKFRNDFLCLQIVMRDVEHYTRHIKEYIEKFLACLSGIELFMRASTNQSPEIESKWTRFNVSMRDLGTIALDDHISIVRKQVIEPFEAAIKAYSPPNTAIVKRGKRRLDYERHLGMKAANKKIDDKTMAQVREYEALNETLKFELPKLAALTERMGKVCMERFVFIQSDWWGTLQAKIKAVSDANHVSKDLDTIVEHFRRDFRYPEARLSELSITKEEFHQSIGTGRLSQSTTATREDDASIHSRTRNGAMSATSRSRGISLNSDHTPNFSAHESQIRFSDGLTQNPETASNRRLTVEYPPISRENWLISPTTAAIESALKGYSPRQSSERNHDPETPWRSVNASDAINIPTRKSSAPQPLSLDVPDTYIQKLRSRYPIEMYENPESPGYSPIDGEPPEGYKVLYLAASLFEFKISGDKRVGDLRYLTYQAGEVFDVIGENGELWLAKNQDDPKQEIGWIWSKHFARLAVD